MTITRNFNLCLNKGNGVAPYINISQYDEEVWKFKLYTENGQRFIPVTGSIIGVKADGKLIDNQGTVDSAGQVVINVTQQMTAAAGKAEFELLIENQTHGTANFVVDVEQRAGENAIPSESDLSLLQEAVNSASEIEDLLGGQDVPTVITPIISDWLDDNITNPSNPPIDTSLTVAGAAADAKKTGDEITDLKSDLGICFDGGFVSVPLTYTDGGYINNTNGEVISYNGWKYTDFVDISDRENDTIYVSTEAPSSTLYNGFYNSEHVFITPFNANTGEISDVPVTAKYVRFSIQSNYNASLSVYKTGYRKAVDELEEKIESCADGIVVLNKDVESYMIQTTAPRNIHLDDATKPKPLSFIHFSDIHTRQPLWNRVVEYGNKFSDYIDFIIHSGDYVGSYQGAYVDLYANGITPNIPLYNVVGNHDTYATASGTLASKESTYALIFNHRDNWDVTAFMSGSNSMTYYKKFTDSNVWMFVLDNYYDQDAQVAWLAERLNNALNDGAHVITVMHEVSRRIVNKLDTGFQTLNDYESVGGNGGNSQGVERISPFDAVIANFINNGGHFVANLVGHEHSDMIGYTSTGVLNIAVECATDDIVWSDARREEGTKTWDAFNVFTVNPNTNTLAIVRIGDNSDTYGRPRNVLCYDYLNKQIVTTH